MKYYINPHNVTVFPRSYAFSKIIAPYVEIILYIYGEPVVPYLYFTGTGQVNYGPPGTGLKVDQWHFDSVHYVAVVIFWEIVNKNIFHYIIFIILI